MERASTRWVNSNSESRAARNSEPHLPGWGGGRAGTGQAAEAAMTRCGGYHLVTARTKGATGCPVTPRHDGAGDRNRTGYVQLGNFPTVLSRSVTFLSEFVA